MPDRILRDELLTSERYWAVSIEAQRLFIHLLLCVDDTGRCSGKNYTVRTSCFPGQTCDPAKLENMLTELVDVDLVRMYHHLGDRFIFIPRFRQRLRYLHSKFPTPPKEINDVHVEKSDSSQTQVRLKSDSSQTQVSGSEVKRSEEKRSEEKYIGQKLAPRKPQKPRGTGFVFPEWLEPNRDVWDAWVEARIKSKHPPTDWAKSLAVTKLATMQEDGHNVRRLLADAAFHGWQSFYPPKEPV